MHISDPLVPAFKELSNVYHELLELEKSGDSTSPDFNAKIVSLQDRLHKVENEKLDAMNAIVPSQDNSKVPFGIYQSLIANL